MTKPLGISDRCRGSQPRGQEQDRREGPSAHLGIHGDGPGSGRGLECSGGEKKFGESDLTFQSHTLTPKLRLSDP